MNQIIAILIPTVLIVWFLIIWMISRKEINFPPPKIQDNDNIKEITLFSKRPRRLGHL